MHRSCVDHPRCVLRIVPRDSALKPACWFGGYWLCWLFYSCCGGSRGGSRYNLGLLGFGLGLGLVLRFRVKVGIELVDVIISIVVILAALDFVVVVNARLLCMVN